MVSMKMENREDGVLRIPWSNTQIEEVKYQSGVHRVINHV